MLLPSSVLRCWALAALALVPSASGSLPFLGDMLDSFEKAVIPLAGDVVGAIDKAVKPLAGDVLDTIDKAVSPLMSNVLETLDKAVSGLLELPLGYNVKDGEEFEYVVVGAGAGGSAVAARLVQAGKAVLLLEAGNDPPPHAYVPGIFPLLMGSSIDWKYRTRPNNVSCLSSIGGQCRWTRGKALGGSTAINFMFYVRGNPVDYEMGLPGWTWSEFKPYFLRAEGLRSHLPESSRPYHNTSGPVKVGLCPEPGIKWHKRLYNGLQEIGFPENADVNAETQIGVSKIVTYTEDGLRTSTDRAYLSLPDVKKKLKLAKGTLVTKVTFDENNVANGVIAVRDISKREITVRASKGVILSAGTVGNPPILIRSGIGPKAHLDDFGIPVRSDLPVGKEVSDHFLPAIVIRGDVNLLEVARFGKEAIKYAANRSGFFASIGLADINIFLNSKCYDFEARKLNDGPGCEVPNLQFFFLYLDRGLASVGTPIVQNVLHFDDNVMAQLAKENARGGIILVAPMLLNPYSRGWIRLNSSDPLQQPDIFPNYFGDDRDVDEMLRAITIVEYLVETKPLKGETEIVHLKFDDCPAYDEDREGYWRCYARHMTYPTMHAAGSCGLGRVLDERLRVNGVKGLRVADLSAMPKVPKGNTAAVSIAMGERMADFLLEEDQSN